MRRFLSTALYIAVIVLIGIVGVGILYSAKKDGEAALNQYIQRHDAFLTACEADGHKEYDCEVLWPKATEYRRFHSHNR